jgi:hypothetical protein
VAQELIQIFQVQQLVTAAVVQGTTVRQELRQRVVLLKVLMRHQIVVVEVRIKKLAVPAL